MKISRSLWIPLGIAITVFTACENKNPLNYSTDFENLRPWVADSSLIATAQAHSGRYAIKSDIRHEYGIGYKMKLKDISARPLRKVKISAWVSMLDTAARPAFVAAINTPVAQNVVYENKQVYRLTKDKNKWVQVTIELNLNKADFNNAQNDLLIYLWNRSEKSALLDDLDVTFEEL